MNKETLANRWNLVWGTLKTVKDFGKLPFYIDKIMKWLEEIQIAEVNKFDDKIRKFIIDLDRIIDEDADLKEYVEIREKWILELSVQTPKQRREASSASHTDYKNDLGMIFVQQEKEKTKQEGDKK